MRPILLAVDPEIIISALIIFQCVMEKTHFLVLSINKQPALDQFKSKAGCV